MKIYKYLLIIIGILLTTSCNDFLDVKPSNKQVVSTYEDVKGLMGAHIKMFKDQDNEAFGKAQITVPFLHSTPGKEDYMLFHFYSDDYDPKEYFISWTGRNNYGLAIKTIDWKDTTVPEEIWQTYYKNIGFYNMILHQISLYPGKNESETNIIKGEAKVLRAWSFFKLLQYFSPYHKNELGLPLNADSEKVGVYDSARKTQTENYDFIINELKEVLGYSTSPSPTYNLFFSKNIINAILAQVYLYKGDSGAKADSDYANAITYAQSALRGGNLSYANFNRNPTQDEQYGTYIDKPYALLTFMCSRYPLYERIQNMVGIPYWPDSGQRASDALYNLFDDTDKRKDVFFNSATHYITKFEGDFQFYYYKYDLFTAAELQLIIAEAYARQGKNTEAEMALKNFTKTRYTTYSPPISNSLLQNILIERRKEFCYEYDMRWVDLTRLQTGWERKGFSNEAAYRDKTYKIEDNDFRFCLPIPLKAEIERNDKIVQNPGW